MKEIAYSSLTQKASAYKNDTIPWLTSLFFVAVVCGAVGYFIGLNSRMSQTKKQRLRPTPSSTSLKRQITPSEWLLGGQPTTIPLTRIPTIFNYATPNPDPVMANWKTYIDPSGFSLQYPPQLWSIETNLSPESNQEDVYFTIQIPNSGKDPLRAGVTVSKNSAYFNGNTASSTDNETLSRWFQGQQSASDIPTQVIIDGYPALETRGGLYIEQYYVIAPGFNTPNAEYLLNFGNPEAGETSGIHNPYSESDPLVKEQLANFHLIISSLRFPTK